MRRVFYFDSCPDVSTSDAAVLSCFDHRIQLVVSKFLRPRGMAHPDMIVGLVDRRLWLHRAMTANEISSSNKSGYPFACMAPDCDSTFIAAS